MVCVCVLRCMRARACVMDIDVTSCPKNACNLQPNEHHIVRCIEQTTRDALVCKLERQFDRTRTLEAEKQALDTRVLLMERQIMDGEDREVCGPANTTHKRTTHTRNTNRRHSVGTYTGLDAHVP